MATDLAQGIFPAPLVSRQGDFLFLTTIYPLDEPGRLVRSGALSPYAGDAKIATQTRTIVERLQGVLADAGSSLDRVVKAEVFLSDPTDFYEFKLVWKEFFPHDPPARCTALIGDDHLIPGCRVSVAAIALAGDAAIEMQTIHTADAPDPMDAEWAPQAVKAGPFVFPSALPATDFQTGIVVGRNPIAPYYGSDTEMQAHYIFQNWDRVLRAAGSGLDQSLKAQAYEVDLATFHDMDGVWSQYMGREAGTAPPTRSSMAVPGLLVPGAAFIATMMFLVPDEQHEKTENRKGLRWHPEDLRNVHYSPGLEAGDWFFMAGQLSILHIGRLEFQTAPRGLPYYFSDIEIQTETAMTLLQEQLTANDMSLANVVDARIFLTEARRDYRGFARAWERIFESVVTPPSINFIPSTQANGLGGVMMPTELFIEIDLIAHRGHGG